MSRQSLTRQLESIKESMTVEEKKEAARKEEPDSFLECPQCYAESFRVGITKKFLIARCATYGCGFVRFLRHNG